MKTLTLLLLSAIVVSANGYLIKVPTTKLIEPKIAPTGWVHVQKLILPLFENICEDSTNPVIVKFSQDFKLDTTNEGYSNPEVIKNLLDLKNNKGLLPKNEIFTEYKIDHLNELKVIYELFYYTNEFNSFYKAACWARQNVNCGLFVDALYSAILTKKETENVLIPAPYEILPNYFIRKDFIFRASSLIAGDELTSLDNIRNDGNSYILDVNYTTQMYENEAESKLVYYNEDIGLNSYYYLTKLKMAPWIRTNFKNNKYGEYLYFMIKQLMARYNLERYSNGLPEVVGIDWDYLNAIPYYDPMLVYSNGNYFSGRGFKQSQSTEKLTLLKNIENNVATIVTHMREGGFNKSDVLNHLMEILILSDKSYETLALQILNDDAAINESSSSALGHFMTTLRDPAFWTINKKMVDIVDKALKVLPVYIRDELYFPGVEVINVEVKKMMTYFENFVFDVTDSLKSGEEDTKFKLQISQSRLTHKPFSIKVNITSLVSQRGFLRIYLGPKIMPGEHALKKNLFMLLESSEINLRYGSNIITRTSAEIKDSSDDLLSLYAIKKRAADAEFGLDFNMKLKTVDEQIKFPSRLIIPKGLPEGLPLQIFVFVVPLDKPLGGRFVNTEIKKDTLLSPGFPLDLDVEMQQLFDLPNALVKDIVITHKDSDDPAINYGGKSGQKSWQNNDYRSPSEPVVLPLAARPDFTLRKEPYDYKSKRGQYGKKEDYTAKRGDIYKKDYTQIVDKHFTGNDVKYDTKLESTTDKIIKHVPDDKTNINKNNIEYVITTERFLNGENTFSLDKKIQDKCINEVVHIDVTNNEINVPDETFDEITHKVLVKNGTIGLYDKRMLEKNAEYSNEIIQTKINPVMEDEKIFPYIILDNSQEESDYKKDDENETIDISKIAPMNNRLPTIYDIIFSPFYEINGSEEKLYE